MAEADWLASEDFARMLRALRPRPDARKSALLGCAEGPRPTWTPAP